MRKKRIISGILCFILVLAMIIPTLVQIIPVKAVNETETIANFTENISTIMIDEEESVPCKQLMEKYKYIVTTGTEEVKGFNLSILINNDIVNIYQNSGQFLLNGKLLPLVIKEMKDETTNETYEFPLNHKPMMTDDDTDLYVSCKTLHQFLNIAQPNNGIYAFEPETTTPIETNQSETTVEETTNNATVTIQSGDVVESTKEKTYTFH